MAATLPSQSPRPYSNARHQFKLLMTDTPTAQKSSSSRVSPVFSELATTSPTPRDRDTASSREERSLQRENNKPIISLKNIQKTYLLGVEGVAALRGVSFDIFPGEFVILLGKSGSGKTSLLNIIGTIDKPTRGEITIGNTRITERTEEFDLAQVRLRRLGFVFQTFNLLPTLTALENVCIPMVLRGQMSRSARRLRAKKLLAQVGLESRLQHYPSQLSGGEQQRVTIARALANRPSLLLLDEPTGDLDSQCSDQIMRLLLDLNEKHGVTLVMVTHDAYLKNVAHRVVHMMDGKVHRVESVSEKKRNAARCEIFQGKEEYEAEIKLREERAKRMSDVDTGYNYELEGIEMGNLGTKSHRNGGSVGDQSVPLSMNNCKKTLLRRKKKYTFCCAPPKPKQYQMITNSPKLSGFKFNSPGLDVLATPTDENENDLSQNFVEV
eukprot:g4076.t1